LAVPKLKEKGKVMGNILNEINTKKSPFGGKYGHVATGNQRTTSTHGLIKKGLYCGMYNQTVKV
jgi:hypothetical protein